MKPYNNSPFKLNNTDEYLQWREKKLSNAKTNKNKNIIDLKKTPPHFYEVSAKPYSSSSRHSAPTLSRQSFGLAVSWNRHPDTNKEKTQSYLVDEILTECSTDNYCLYSIEDYKNYNLVETKRLIRSLAQDCGLTRLDGNICADEDSLTSICCKVNKGQHEYIPYTNKKLSWHTDGYYNLPVNTVNSMLLHCFKAAKNGGESAFMDHDIAYILLRDENPKWIEALSRNKVMTIPANILNGKVIRPEQTGPVFSVTPQGRLHMRYSARQRNIFWEKDKTTLEAVEFLQTILNSDSNCSSTTDGSEYIVRHELKAGEGIISRNVLHCRSAFDEIEPSAAEKTSSGEEKYVTAQQRLLFRGRYYDEIQ